MNGLKGLGVGEGERSRIELMIVSKLTVLKSPKSKPRSEVFQRKSYLLSPRWTNTDSDSDEQIVEALKSKKFKVITITHGTFPSPPPFHSAQEN
jgi:hypothetical protein